MIQMLLYTNQGVEAETSVLGSVLLDDSVMDDIVSMLEPRDFSVHAHELIWKGMQYLYQHHKPIDAVTLSDMLMRYKRIEEVGGVEYLTKLADSVPTTANAKHYAEIVRSRAIRRRGADVAKKIEELSLEGDFENDEDYFSEVEKLAASIRPNVGGNMKHISDTKKEYLDYLREKDDLILTGFRRFDEWMGGIGRGWLYILAGRPSVGKTAKMLQMAKGIAKQGKGEVLIWSQEMKREQLLNRMIAAEAGVNANFLRRKNLQKADWKKVEQAYARLEQLPLHIHDASNVTIEEVRAVARQVRRKYGKLAAIIVDYLTIMNIPQRNGETWAQAVARVTRKAKNVAGEMDCPFIMLAQLNRESKKQGNKEPQLEHLRDSGGIEQDADVVEFLWENPDDTDPNGRGTIVQSTIAKGRDVGLNKFRYLFKPWFQTYEELET